MSEFEETETRVLRNPTTLRNIAKIARGFCLTGSGLISILKGKTIIDIGSGFNGLAIDVALRKIDCEVYSVDPQIGKSDFEERQRLILTDNLYKQFSQFDPLEVEAARKTSLDKAYPYFAHDMPLFKEGQFNLLIDHYAIFGYFQDEAEKSTFLKTIAEERRVLASGSPLYIADFTSYGQTPPEPSNWKEQELTRMGIRYKPTPCAFSIIAYNEETA